MPSSNIHLLVSDSLKVFYTISDLPSYYLGSISPDAVCENKNFDRNEKRFSHFTIKNKDLNLRIQNCNNKYAELKQQMNENFLKGYMTHLYTDYLFSHTIARYYLKKINEENRFYKEQLFADKTINDKHLENNMAKTTLLKAKDFDFSPYCSAIKIRKWKEMYLNDIPSFPDEIQNAELKEPIILNEEFIKKFVKTAVEFTKAVFGKNNIEAGIIGQYPENHLIKKRMLELEGSG